MTKMLATFSPLFGFGSRTSPRAPTDRTGSDRIHWRPWPYRPRRAPPDCARLPHAQEDVDARHKAGHDDVADLKLERSCRADQFSPGTEQPDRFVAREQIKKLAQRLTARRTKFRIAVEDEGGVFARRAQELAVHFEPRDAKTGQAALPRAEHIAFAAQSQIFLGDAEAVIGFA